MLLLAGSLGWGSYSTAQENPVQTKQPASITISQPQQPKSFQDDIQRELRKQDTWIEGYVKTDYTRPTESHVALKILPESLLKRLEKMGNIKFLAAYNPKEDALLLPEPLNKQQEQETIDSIDHELFHAIYDEEGSKGLLHSQNIVGPSMQEIRAYTKVLTSRPEFNKLREELRAREEWESLNGYVKKVSATVLQKGVRTLEIFKKALEYRETKKEVGAFLDKKDQEAIQQGISDMGEKLRWYAEKAKPTIAEMSRILEEDKKTPEGKRGSLEEILKRKGNIAKSIEQLSPIADLYTQARALKKTVEQAYEKAEEKNWESELRKMEKLLEKFPPGEEKERELKRIQEDRELMRGNRELGKSLKSWGDAFEETTTTIAEMMPKISAANNIYQIDAILNSPNEVMARVVDSLYSLHVGPVTQNKFPLHPEDIAFLSRFKRKQEGKEELLFKKGIEKYTLATTVIAEGHDPAAIKTQLEYATTATYQGRTWQWPEANITLQGKIPQIEIKKREEKNKK